MYELDLEWGLGGDGGGGRLGFCRWVDIPVYPLQTSRYAIPPPTRIKIRQSKVSATFFANAPAGLDNNKISISECLSICEDEDEERILQMVIKRSKEPKIRRRRREA